MLETINLDNGLTTAGQSLAPFGSLFTQSGVLRPNSFSVSALTSPGMFVEVSGSDDDDIAIIKTADGSTYFVRNTLNLQVPILANSSGVTKTDAIVLFVDLAAGDDENAGSPGAAQIIAVRRDGVGTGLPNDGEIDAATSNNPWVFLKGVEVEHGAGEIEDEDLAGTADRALFDANLLTPESIGELLIATGAITTGKVANNAITEAKQVLKGSFSTSEVNTGAKWIDGKDIYKKTIDLGGMPSNTTKNVAHGISNLQNIIHMEGWTTATTYHLNLPTPGIAIVRNGANIVITTTSTEWAPWVGWLTLYYTKPS